MNVDFYFQFKSIKKMYVLKGLIYEEKTFNFLLIGITIYLSFIPTYICMYIGRPLLFPTYLRKKFEKLSLPSMF